MVIEPALWGSAVEPVLPVKLRLPLAVTADTVGSDYDTRLCVFYGSRGALNEVQAQKSQFDDYVRETAGGGAAAEIEKAKGLLDQGAITQAEFDAIKQKALAAA